MKKTFLFSLMLLLSFMSQAAQRSVSDAQLVALRFMQRAKATTRATGNLVLVARSNELSLSKATTRFDGEPTFYVFNIDTKGYVIVSADDRMVDVLAYSDEGSFVKENMPDNLRYWLSTYVEQLAALNDEAGAEVIPAWRPVSLANGQPESDNTTTFSLDSQVKTATTRAAAKVAPLLGGIMWDQDEPYNLLCPKKKNSSNEKELTVTGCVATAMAQVMKYHQWPDCGVGTNSYTGDGTTPVTIAFNYDNNPFDWANMLDTYKPDQYTTEQGDAVALLMKACGVSVNMKYGLSADGGSGAYAQDIPGALSTYFKYHPNVSYLTRDCFSIDEWRKIMKEELSAGRPVLYGGASNSGGHAFVADGYDEAGLFHMNWGWSGSGNGYFALDGLNPSYRGAGGGNTDGGAFSQNQDIVVGIAKPEADIAFKSCVTVDSLLFNDHRVLSTPLVVNKSDVLQVRMTSLNNLGRDFRGKMVLMAEQKGEGMVISDEIPDVSIPSFKGYGEYKFTMNFPTYLTDGTYRVYMACMDNREDRYAEIHHEIDAPCRYQLTVAGETCTLTAISALDINTDLSATVELKHAVTAGGTADIVVKWNNRSTQSEYYGNMGFLICTPGSDDAAPRDIAYYSSLVVIEKGAVNQELSYSIKGLKQNQVTGSTKTNIPEGEYVIYPTFSWGDKVYMANEGTPLTIGAAVAQATLTVSNFQLDKTVYTLGDQMKLTADLTLTNGTLYEGTIAAAFFESGSSSTSNVVAKDIRVEGTGKLDWTFTPNITQAGTYNVALYEMTDDGSRQLTSTVGFSVTNPMGIEDEAAAPEQLIIYSQPVEDVLRFATPSTVEQIEIYSLNGGAVKKVTAGAQSGTTCQVEVSTLSSGLYVVKVQTKDGRRLGGKFLKK